MLHHHRKKKMLHALIKIDPLCFIITSSIICHEEATRLSSYFRKKVQFVSNRQDPNLPSNNSLTLTNYSQILHFHINFY